jgi:hypothetical protein
MENANLTAAALQRLALSKLLHPRLAANADAEQAGLDSHVLERVYTGDDEANISYI